MNNLIASGDVTMEHLFDARMLIEPLFQLHRKILQVIEEKRPEKAERLIKEDILDVRKKIKNMTK